MFVFILWFAILQGNGEFATFSAPYKTAAACEAGKKEVLAVDISKIDPAAVIRHIECVKVDATPKAPLTEVIPEYK